MPPPFAVTGFLPPQTMLAGRYIILRRVGRGGMGAVYQAAVYQAAADRISGKRWAIKDRIGAPVGAVLARLSVDWSLLC
jgi:hypothetical protein